RRQAENERLLFEISRAHDQSRKVYGSPRITEELKENGLICSENRIARLMRLHGIAAKTKKKFKVTTHSKHHLPLAKDRVKRDFYPEEPNQLWGSDITCISTGEAWLDLAVVMDLYSRKIVGWSMKERLYRE